MAHNRPTRDIHRKPTRSTYNEQPLTEEQKKLLREKLFSRWLSGFIRRGYTGYVAPTLNDGLAPEITWL